MNSHKTIGYYFYNDTKKKSYSLNKDKFFETSSTIKVPILYFTLLKIVSENIPFEKVLKVENSHLSTGSGLVNWTDWRKLTLSDTVLYTVKYSDCVTTNMLIDFVGGKRVINSKLKKMGFKTRLIKPLIIFKSRENVMPRIGITTPYEMHQLFVLLFDTIWPVEIKHLLRKIFNDINASWFDAYIPDEIKRNLWHKTGSMINIGRYGDTAFNVAGEIIYSKNKYSFSFMTRTRFSSKPTDRKVESLQQSLVKKFLDLLYKYSNR